VTIDISNLPALGATFLLVFARTGTMVMLLPGLGEQNISTRLRLTIALILAAVLLPLHREAYQIDTSALAPTIVRSPKRSVSTPLNAVNSAEPKQMNMLVRSPAG